MADPAGAADLLAAIAATGADTPVRLKGNRNLPVIQRYPDGSTIKTKTD